MIFGRLASRWISHELTTRSISCSLLAADACIASSSPGAQPTLGSIGSDLMKAWINDCVPFRVVMIPDWEIRYHVLTPSRGLRAEFSL